MKSQGKIGKKIEFTKERPKRNAIPFLKKVLRKLFFRENFL